MAAELEGAALADGCGVALDPLLAALPVLAGAATCGVAAGRLLPVALFTAVPLACVAEPVVGLAAVTVVCGLALVPCACD